MVKRDPNSIWMISHLNDSQFLPFAVQKAVSLSELPPTIPQAIILTKTDGQSWPKLVQSLRAHQDCRYTPLFYHGEIDESAKHLFDGPADNSLLIKAHAIQQRLAKISPNMLHAEEKEAILLNYLFSRPQLHLHGQVNYHLAHIYQYPLLDALIPSSDKADNWQFLEDLVLRGLLQPERLLDEIKTCASCFSGLLNIKNECPHCHSIKIKSEKLIHCYTCGKIAPIAEFLRNKKLVCGSCHSKLNKIGLDYVHPAEDKICLDCGHNFAEAAVNLVCLVCGRISTPQELSMRPLYEYSLTRRAEYLVQGMEKEIYQSLNPYFNMVDYQVFMDIVAWQVKLVARYPAWHFSVMTIKILNEARLLEEKGKVNTERMMGKFLSSLRQVIRETDLSARVDGGMFFFLPLTESEGCQVLINRIQKYINTKEDKSLRAFTVGISFITSTEMLNKQLETDKLATELRARITQSDYLLNSKN